MCDICLSDHFTCASRVSETQILPGTHSFTEYESRDALNFLTES